MKPEATTAPPAIIQSTEAAASKKALPAVTPPPVAMVDMTAHNGLRGACAMWVVLGHCLNYYVRMDASAIMPLFFMLSGFSLTAMYGRTEWALPPSTCCPPRARTSSSSSSSSNSNDDDDDDSAIEEGSGGTGAGAGTSIVDADNTTAFLAPPTFAMGKFYRNRAARILPVFYTCVLLAVPFYLLNLNPLPLLPSLLVTLLPCATLLSFLGLDSNFNVVNGPGWFVCTLVWFWLAFPWWLPRAQRLSDAQLTARIAWGFYLQLAFMFGWYLFFQDALGGGPPAFNTAGKNPISRFPLFLMGMYAGLLCLRHPPAAAAAAATSSKAAGGDGTAAAPAAGAGADTTTTAATAAAAAAATAQQEEAEERDEMPWPSCVLGFPLPPLPCLTARLSSSSPSSSSSSWWRGLLLATPATQREWAHKASRESVAILLLSALICIGESLFAAGNPGHVGFQAQLWWQAVVPMVQLNIIVALTRDGGASLAARTLRNRVSQYLGKISMTLYLVHMPLMAYLSLMFHPGAVPVLVHCHDAASLGAEQQAACRAAVDEARAFPVWYTVILVPLSIAVSEMLYRLVEVPARRALRAK